MHYIATIQTSGGPVAILPFAALSSWDGDADYYRITRLEFVGSMGFIPKFRRGVPLCVCRHESDGNFSVYADHHNILVLSEIYAETGCELSQQPPSFAAAFTTNRPVKLDYFGGRLAVFDAAAKGRCLYLNDEEVVQDAALLCVETGCWEARDIFYKDARLSYSGMMLEWKGNVVNNASDNASGDNASGSTHDT